MKCEIDAVMSQNSEPKTQNSSSGAKVVRLKKPHACGGNDFTVVRESVVVTLKCNTCGSFVRLTKEKFDKAVPGTQYPVPSKDKP